MFFPVESLRRGGRFYLCWVADSWPLRFATISHRQLWSQDIRQICDELLEVIKNESGQPANKFSLRLSAQLLRGLVRLYQRKVSIVVGEICMINARVMKATNKRLACEPDDEPAYRPAQLPLLAIEEPADEERVVERIQDSGNVVANIEDITLRDPIIPQIQPFLDDGFGELHVQAQMMELEMRAAERVEQLSALSLATADETAARSRLELSALRPFMEGVSEIDISIFKKSMGESQLPAADFDKEIPDIPEIHPEMPAPQIDNKGPEAKTADNQQEPPSETSSDKRKTDDEEFILDELPSSPKRRRKNKLIIDKRIQLTNQYMISRLQSVHVEMRCENSSADRMKTLVTAANLLSRPAHAGTKLHSNLGYTHLHSFIMNLNVPDRQHSEDREMEKALTARQKRSKLRAAPKTIAEEPIEQAELQEVRQEVQPDVSNIPIDLDFSLLPTQIIIKSPQEETQKRASELEHSSKRIRRSEDCRLTQEFEIVQGANDKENVPENYQSVGDTNIGNVPVTPADVQLTEMLQAEGLADVRPLSERSRLGERSETPLGSLDRTKVSLGDESEKTTDSKRFIGEEWGTRGTMIKIYRAIRSGEAPLRVETLVARGPQLAGHTRIIAARCFTAILKLKQHGFVNVITDSGTKEILDIQLGTKIISRI